jgi:hypothetical protein
MKKVMTEVGHNHPLWQYLFDKNHLLSKIMKDIQVNIFLSLCDAYLYSNVFFDYQSYQTRNIRNT